MGKGRKSETVVVTPVVETPVVTPPAAEPTETVVVRLYSTQEAARAGGAPNGKSKSKNPWKLFLVTSPDGSQNYVWANAQDHAVYQVANIDGYKAVLLDKKPVAPATITGMLATLSPEDRAAILESFKS